MAVNTNLWNRMRYTAFAPIYDYIATFSKQRRRSIELLNLRPGERVLIVGAGTGADLSYIPAGVHVTAIDITPAMVERIRQRAAELGRPVDARVMDGHHLDFDPGSFDAVILHLILAVIPDPLACIASVERVLKPGGRAVVFDKFVPEDQEPSLGRRMLNLVTNFVFSDITRKLGPILAGTHLKVQHRESAALGGRFEISLLTKLVG